MCNIDIMSKILRYCSRILSNDIPKAVPTSGAILTIRTSQIDKTGSFASTDVTKGDFIRSMSGDLVTQREILRRIKRGRLSPDDPLQIDADNYIDLDPASLSINHSCDPNSAIRQSNELIAIRNISTGDEVTFDYSTTVTLTIEPYSWSMRCNCGSGNCRSIIGNVSTVPESLILKYFQMNALPRYIVEELGLSSDS